MKKNLYLLLITGTLLCMYLVSCTEKVYEIEAREATKEIEKAVLVTSEPHEEKPILTTSFSSSNFCFASRACCSLLTLSDSASCA